MFENQRPTSGRSTLVQRRGIERVQAILDTAETLLAEEGYEAATLKAVGERAGIPTASLYHYFADRGQVDAELVRRHLRALNERFSAALTDSAVKTLADAVDAMIDPLLTYFRENPSFVQLWFVGRTSSLSKLANEFDASWAEALRHFLIEHELIDESAPQFVTRLAFEVGDRLFDVAFQLSPTGDDTTIDECRRILAAYLATYATSTPSGDKKRR